MRKPTRTLTRTGVLAAAAAAALLPLAGAAQATDQVTTHAALTTPSALTGLDDPDCDLIIGCLLNRVR
ncbi:hypothetical protein ACSNOI_44090 [Actinomadura kijaniata]|uniref:hypothetical protein n=1 Tax=Actinomadura kijaniata TaxID=46161 RepID=UPI003F1BDC52